MAGRRILRAAAAGLPAELGASQEGAGAEVVHGADGLADPRNPGAGRPGGA